MAVAEEGFEVIVEVAGKVGDGDAVDACTAFVGGNAVEGGGEVVEGEGEHGMRLWFGWVGS